MLMDKSSDKPPLITKPIITILIKHRFRFKKSKYNKYIQQQPENPLQLNSIQTFTNLSTKSNKLN